MIPALLKENGKTVCRPREAPETQRHQGNGEARERRQMKISRR